MASSFVASRAHGSLSMSSCAPSSSGTPEAGPSNRSSTWLGDGNAVLRSSATIGGKLNFGVGFCHASKSSSRSVVKAEATSLDEVEEPQQKFDVSSNCVTPSFRSGPWQGTDNEVSWRGKCFNSNRAEFVDHLVDRSPARFVTLLKISRKSRSCSCWWATLT
jgi:hypothetical protein